ncbi:hypothetical protein RR48_14500 [Papilio machaon]|uniref:Uncharacterized protein n=1 Tax=Papilio machaon TaxID=76193 RepID=A0A194QKG0_PAPMA|nr:hypothetical protein RR48_14500 [Papilio machaon]
MKPHLLIVIIQTGQIKPENLSFYAINVNQDSRQRTVKGIGIGSISGTAYLDSCTNTSVASYKLYVCLKQAGYQFAEQRATVTGRRDQAEADNLLSEDTGVGFIQDAGMVLNIPQLTWHFIDDPDMIYELQEEDAIETTMTQVDAVK